MKIELFSKEKINGWQYIFLYLTKNCGSLFRFRSLLFLRFFNHCTTLFLSLSELWIPRILLFHWIFHLLFWVKKILLIFFYSQLLLLEHRHNPDPANKLVYAVADGQYTFGPLSLYQYHNDEKYSKTYV